MLSIEVLICTMERNLHNVADVLLTPVKGVRYLVSCQYENEQPSTPAELIRDDVRVICQKGRGLSRNRNHALLNARGDILLLADDDERIIPMALQQLPTIFKRHPHWDLVQLQFTGTGKTYPAQYVSSVELAMRRKVAQSVRFDTRFGLGSRRLASGEEEIFVHDAKAKGYKLYSYPLTICSISGTTTGSNFISDKRVQRSKGAVFAYTRGKCYALYRCTREALGWMIRRGVNPFPLLYNMYWGILYV